MTASEDDLPRAPPLVCRLYEIVDELEALFPGRSFTPDGHLVGSIGESLAAYMFDLDLVRASKVVFEAGIKSAPPSRAGGTEALPCTVRRR